MIVEEKVLEVLHYMEFVFLGELACHKLQNEIPNLPKNHGELTSSEIASSYYFFCILFASIHCKNSYQTYKVKYQIQSRYYTVHTYLQPTKISSFKHR